MKRHSFILLGVLIILIAETILYLRPISHFVWRVVPSPLTATLAGTLNHTDASLQLELGRYFFGGGVYDLDRAKTAYDRVLSVQPREVIAHYQLARIYFLKGDFFLAIRHINRVLEIDPNFTRGYYMKGLILGYRGDLLEATYAFERYVELVPTTWAGRNDLAWLYFQLGQYEKILPIAQDGLIYDPDNPWLLNMNGLALFNLGEKEEAKQYFEKARSAASEMQPADWGVAYPGNDPAIYAEGLERMREALAHNFNLIRSSEE